MGSSATVVVLGLTSYTPYAGVSWQTAQYLEGLTRLGYDVYYVEDHGYWPYDPYLQEHTNDCSGTVRFISELMAQFGMEDRWAYRDIASNGQVFGMSARRLGELLHGADVLLNLTGSTELRDVHLDVPVRLYLETDPVLAQIELANGDARTLELMGTHTHHASYGENFGAPDCGVPTGAFDYIPTRPPVILDWWTPAEVDSDAPYTTIASWEQSFKDVEWGGERYTWSKHSEFLKLLDLPSRSPRRMELALATSDQDALALLRGHGWSVIDATGVSSTLERYRDYVRRSWGEFTVAKDQNVRLRSGWFSDRSACFLAAGRPVITQDTGFANLLPTGEGLFAFRERDEILAAFDEVEARPEHHRRAARRIAEDWFRAEDVLATLMTSLATSPAPAGGAR
jgi:hypothetical protein